MDGEVNADSGQTLSSLQSENPPRNASHAVPPLYRYCPTSIVAESPWVKTVPTASVPKPGFTRQSKFLTKYMVRSR